MKDKTVYDYIAMLENGCRKSLASNGNYEARGAKIWQLKAIEEIKARLKRLEELESNIEAPIKDFYERTPT